MHSTGSTEGVAFLAVAIMETKIHEKLGNLTMFDILDSLVTSAICQGYENGCNIMMSLKSVVLLKKSVCKEYMMMPLATYPQISIIMMISSCCMWRHLLVNSEVYVN